MSMAASLLLVVAAWSTASAQSAGGPCRRALDGIHSGRLSAARSFDPGRQYAAFSIQRLPKKLSRYRILVQHRRVAFRLTAATCDQSLTIRRRSALPTTLTEESAIAAATIGESIFADCSDLICDRHRERRSITDPARALVSSATSSPSSSPDCRSAGCPIQAARASSRAVQTTSMRSRVPRRF